MVLIEISASTPGLIFRTLGIIGVTGCHRLAVAQRYPLTTGYELLFPEAFMNAARVPSNPAQAHDVDDVEEKIRIRAYLLFEKRGGEHGHDLADWLQAEADILRSTLSAPPVRVTPIRATPAKKSRTKQTSV